MAFVPFCNLICKIQTAAIFQKTTPVDLLLQLHILLHLCNTAQKGKYFQEREACCFI
jgi:hypothetical protein